MMKIKILLIFLIIQNSYAMESEKESKRWEKNSEISSKEQLSPTSKQGNPGLVPGAIKQTGCLEGEGLRLRKPIVKKIEK